MVCLAWKKPWVPALALHKRGMVKPTCDPSSWEIMAEGSEVQGSPQLQSKFEATLGYRRVQKQMTKQIERTVRKGD